MAGMLACGTSLSAYAATFCVGTASELKQALSSASGNTQNNTIKVSSGTYPAPDGGFLYYRDSGNYALDLEGGWDDACTAQTADASLTTLDGQSLHNILIAENDSVGGDITIRYFNFVHGLDQNGFSPALEASAYNGTTRVQNCRFRLNAASGPVGAIRVGTHDGVVNFADNIVANNLQGASSNVLFFDMLDGATATGAFRINDNTIADNDFGSYTTAVFAAMYVESNAQSSLANNILWNNGDNLDGNGPYGEIYTGGTSLLLLDDDIDHPPGSMDRSSSGNFSADPLFVGPNNHHVLDRSPVVDAGVNDPPGGMRAIDLDGNPRIVNARVDIGAYEVQDVVFADGFEPR